MSEGRLKSSSALVQKLTHKLNRKFVQIDDATNDSEETAAALTISKTNHNSRMSFTRIKIQENIYRVSFRGIVTVEQLQRLSSYSWNRHTHTRTHSQLYSIPRAELRLEA